MATKLQRTQAILDALTDGVTPPAIVGRTLDAFVVAYAPNEAATMTNAQKATVFMAAVRHYVRQTVHGIESNALAEAARKTATPPNMGED